VYEAAHRGIIRSMRKHIAKLLVVGVVAAVPVVASAADKDKKPAADTKSASASASKVSKYDQAIIDAHKAFAAGLAGNQLDDAVAGYRKAIAIDPNRPEGHLYLGGALFLKGDYAGAEESAGTAASRAKASKEFTNFQGKALFLVATTKEAEGKQDEAKQAWMIYADFAKANPDQEYPKGSGDAPPMAVKVFPASALDRTTKIDAYQKMKDEYAKVRDLIEKRQKELGIPTTTGGAPK
jgi:tetratricopeptide (TPR) repeat protein